MGQRMDRRRNTKRDRTLKQNTRNCRAKRASRMARPFALGVTLGCEETRTRRLSGEKCCVNRKRYGKNPIHATMIQTTSIRLDVSNPRIHQTALYICMFVLVITEQSDERVCFDGEFGTPCSTRPSILPVIFQMSMFIDGTSVFDKFFSRCQHSSYNKILFKARLTIPICYRRTPVYSSAYKLSFICF